MVYVAGPYRGKNEFQVLQNIRKAEALGWKVWKAGAVAIVPQVLLAHASGLLNDDPQKDFSAFMDGCLETVRRCDCIVALDDWPLSEGAKLEIDYCKNKLGKPVFTESTFADFLNWMTAEKMKK